MYNFKRTFGDTFKVDTFSNVMNFIHSYNDASIKLGSNNEEEILAELKGYDPAVASKILNAIKVQFGGVPSREKETQFMRDYYSYMKNTYEEQRAKVIQAQESCEKAKKYQAPNGVNYSAKELAKSGAKAKKKARNFRWLKFALVMAGAIAGSFLLPMVAVNLFAGVASVQAMSAISMITGIAGLVGGGLLGNRIANAGGRKERYLANKELAQFWDEMQESVNQEQAQLQAEEDKLRAIEKDFGLELDTTTSTMESEAFNNMYNQYSTAPLSRGAEGGIGTGIPFGESEHEFDDEAGRGEEPVIGEEGSERKTPSESTQTPEPEKKEPEINWEDGGEETPAEPEPAEPAPEEGSEESPAELDPEEPAPAEPEPEEPTPEPENGGEDAPVEPEPEVPSSEPEEPEPIENNPYEEPITEDKKKIVMSSMQGRFTKSINVCSSVGRYMLVDLRESVMDQIRQAETMGDVRAIVDNTIPEISNIKSDYVRYVANKTGNNLTRKNGTFMQELPQDKMGAKAMETELPKDYLSKNSGQTFFTSVATTYINQNETLIKNYTKAKYGDLTPAQRKANARALYEKSKEIAHSGLDFAEIDKNAMEFQKQLAEEVESLQLKSLTTPSTEDKKEDYNQIVRSVTAEELNSLKNGFKNVSERQVLEKRMNNINASTKGEFTKEDSSERTI